MSESHKHAARRRFDRWAKSYESDRRSRFNAGPQQAALAALDLQPNDRLLDVGCGTGAAVRAAAATVERAVGVDLSPQMIERARELATDAPGAEFVVGDSENLPFEPDAFTAVLCTASFHHYPDPQKAMAEMVRVLTPDGRLVIADGVADRRAARIADRILRVVDRGHFRLYRTEELVGLMRRQVSATSAWIGSGTAVLPSLAPGEARRKFRLQTATEGGKPRTPKEGNAS
jgi:ubiquinone/menaquinone biosynthesis C-methylase UbiE